MKQIPVRQITTAPTVGELKAFSIRKVEDLLTPGHLVHALHRHDFYFILAVHTGSGTHGIDFTEYAVDDYNVFLLRPGQVHELRLEMGSTGYLLEFSPNFYHPLNPGPAKRLRKASARNYYPLDRAGSQRIQTLLHSIEQEYRNLDEGYADGIHSYLDLLFIELVRQRAAEGASPAPTSSTAPTPSYMQERWEEFRELLESRLDVYKQVAQYAGLMHLSPYQLNEITKATLGKTASELINQQIVLEAKRYLLATSEQIQAIADILGYEDVSYFIRFFKKHTGHTPEAFRHTFS